MNPRRNTSHAERGCRCRRALIQWIDGSGAPPADLARHVHECPTCHKWAQRVARLHGAMTMLTTQTIPIGMTGRANEKALRMIARRLRETPKAVKLRQAKPSPKLWTKIEAPASRAASAAAAAMILLSLRTGVAEGVERTRQFAEPLADTHFERHIADPKVLGDVWPDK